MGNQKLKWTAVEEQALIDGIHKHGPGKWKNILRDPEFKFKLTHRSNIDLKDKWRNLNVTPSVQGCKDKTRTPQLKAAATGSPSTLSRTSSEVSLDETGNNATEPKNAPRYDGMIYEALTALADDGIGSDISTILNFIEQQGHEVPSNFRRILGSRLRRLADTNRLEKCVQFKSNNTQQTINFYKLIDNSLRTKTPLVARPKENNVKGPAVSEEMVGEAATTAAYKLVEVENKIDVVNGAVEEVERMIKLAERAECILLMAEEIHKQCSLEKTVEID